MRQHGVVPNGRERTFGREEIIVSKTDPKGRITYANDVFVRVSGYTEAELVGKPHSIIRHPDMPRAVFKLLWDTISSGKEVFAYVNNLTATGENYWVLAHVTPSYDRAGNVSGYHSNRRSPEPTAIEKVTPLYRELLAVERAHDTGNAAVAASTAALNDKLATLGLSYDQFIWQIIAEGKP